MNFFEHQARARKQSRMMVVAFILATVLIVVAVDAVVLFSIATFTIYGGGYADFFSINFILSHLDTVVKTSIAVLALIVLSSMYKVSRLRRGGAQIARDLGGEIVDGESKDPLERRLHNVVEEIAIASGVPVPDVFVLREENGINAFAAGYGHADAAIAVTQGTLEKLDRNELQGVVAHEFSHVFNGDMRLNIRLMGVSFGILVIAIIGKRILDGARYSSRSRRDNGAAIFVFALAFLIVGYLGVFFARWIKSAISRQREYLADASAVQFTRDNEGIAGALKKIAANNSASYLRVDAEEISHMLFGVGNPMHWFATHPPIEKRIERLGQSFDQTELAKVADEMRKIELNRHQQAIKARVEEKEAELARDQFWSAGEVDIDGLFSHVGNPSLEQMLVAGVLTHELSLELSDTAHSKEWAPELIFYSLLDTEENIREKQLLLVLQRHGEFSEQKVRHLLTTNKQIKAAERMPLLELVFPALKKRPFSELLKIEETIKELVLADEKMDSFEYLLCSLLTMYLKESQNPSANRFHGNAKLDSLLDDAVEVISVIAMQGKQVKGNEGIQEAQKAFTRGMQALGISTKSLIFKDHWQDRLEGSLERLDKLAPPHKSHFLNAVSATISDNGKMEIEEHELLRAITARLHVPLPIFDAV